MASNLGQLYLETEDYTKTDVFLQEAISIFEKTENGTNLSICYHLK